jgi:hypothetical protein
LVWSLPARRARTGSREGDGRLRSREASALVRGCAWKEGRGGGGRKERRKGGKEEGRKIRARSFEAS